MIFYFYRWESASDLRILKRSEKTIPNFGNRLAIPLNCFQSLPVWMRQKGLPGLGMLVHILISQHVGQVREIGTKQGLAEKDGIESDLSKNIELTFIEHFNLQRGFKLVMAFIDPQLKDSIPRSRDFNIGIPSKASIRLSSIR